MKKNRGQILIVVLLIVIVGLTTVLMVLSGTTTDVGITTRVTDSSRAFNAAEAGIEEAIRSISDVSQGVPIPYASGLTYTVTSTDLGSDAIYPGPATSQQPLAVGDVFTAWLVPHLESTGDLDLAAADYNGPTIDVCITRDTGRPALGVTVFYQQSGELRSSFAVLNDSATPISSSISSDPIGTTCPSYARKFVINFATHFGPNLTGANAKLLALRLKVMLAETKVAVDPVDGAGFPKQGNTIQSTGIASEIIRKIEVKEPYTEPAPFLDHVLFSRSLTLPLRH